METSDTYLNSLLSFIDEQEVQEFGDFNNSETYSICNIDHANYIAKKIKELRNQKEAIESTAEQELNKYVNKIETWKSSCIDPLLNQEKFLLNLLQNFVETQLEGSSKKSIKLINGTAQFRNQQDKYEYNDDILLPFLQQSIPDCIDNKPQINKTKLKKIGTVKNGHLYIEETQIPGVSVIKQEDKFYLK